MSKMIKVESCTHCDIRLRGFCDTFNKCDLSVFVGKKATDVIEILPNCPLEDYPECCACPTCYGEKELPNGIHSQTLSEWEDSSDTFEKCKTCKGIGTIQVKYER